MSILRHVAWMPRRLNPILLPIAHRRPPLAVLHHTGRRSGRAYDTPVQAFPTRDGFLVALAYNSNPNWALNFLASGQADMTRAGKRYRITEPRRRGAEARAELPTWASLTMRALRADEFLLFTATPNPPDAHPGPARPAGPD